jgi:hypothetical protein
LTNLKQGLKPVNEYYQEMELIMQRAKVREPAEQTMQLFLFGLTYQIHSIFRHHPYNDMAHWLHQACEAAASVAEEAKSSRPTATRSRFSSWASSAGQPTVGTRDSSSVGGSKAPTGAKSGAPAAKSVAQPTMSGSGSTTSNAQNRDMACHTCGGKGHFKRDCPNELGYLTKRPMGMRLGLMLIHLMGNMMI